MGGPFKAAFVTPSSTTHAHHTCDLGITHSGSHPNTTNYCVLIAWLVSRNYIVNAWPHDLPWQIHRALHRASHTQRAQCARSAWGEMHKVCASSRVAEDCRLCACFMPNLGDFATRRCERHGETYLTASDNKRCSWQK